MNKYFIIILLIALGISQDRSVIFNTGSPDNLEHGYTVSSTQFIANRISVSNDYVLEAMAFYMTTTIDDAIVRVSIRVDDNGSPGDLVSELAEWDHTVTYPATNGYNLIVTTDLCIYLDAGNLYWWTIQGIGDTEATWVYSNSIFYPVSTSDDSGTTWTGSTGFAGAGGVWAEQIYSLPYELGDVNFDFLTNVVDIVLIVGEILDSNPLNEDAIHYADINSDDFINVVDLVLLTNIILTQFPPNSDFSLEDINAASEFYEQNIGPSFFDGQVSAYYFGKQG